MIGSLPLNGARPQPWWSVMAVLWLSACASAPPYPGPAVPAVNQYTLAQMSGATESADVPFGQAQNLVNGATDAAWWKALRAPALDALIDDAWRANPTLAAAQAVLTQARELQAAQEGAALWPQAELGVGAQRQQVSPSAQGLPGDTREYSLYNASVGVRYRFDLGGGTDSSLRAAGARAEQRQHEEFAARHALAAQLVTAAIARAGWAGQIEAQTDQVNTQLELLRLTEARARWGQARPEELSALQAQTESMQAGLAQLRKQLRQSEHLLAVLAGRVPAQGVPAFTLADFVLPERLPVAVPAEWVRRRPDILAAEAGMRAAHAEWAVAMARRYPQINLSANLGSQALTTSALFGGAAAVWSVVGQLSQPLFNAGLPAEQRAAQAAFDVAAAQYQRVVLDALRGVADALSAVEHDAQVLSALARGVQASEAQRRVVDSQYRAGVSNWAQRLLADQQWQQARQGLMNAQVQRLNSTVALSAALLGEPPTQTVGAADPTASP